MSLHNPELQFAVLHVCTAKVDCHMHSIPTNLRYADVRTCTLCVCACVLVHVCVCVCVCMCVCVRER